MLYDPDSLDLKCDLNTAYDKRYREFKKDEEKYDSDIVEETKKEVRLYLKSQHELRELNSRDTHVNELYAQSYLPYEKGEPRGAYINGDEYGDKLDDLVLIKACQNDIRMLLKEFGEGFSGKLIINFQDGAPSSMLAKLQYNKEEDRQTIYEKIKNYIGNFGFVAYMKILNSFSKVISEKYFRYTDKGRYTSEEDGVFLMPKKEYKKLKKQNITLR